MKEQEIDQLTKDFLKIGTPKPTSDLESKVMLKIHAASQISTFKFNNNLLYLTLVSIISFVAIFLFSSNFSNLDFQLRLPHFIFNLTGLSPIINYTSFVFAGFMILVALYFFYFFDLLLADFYSKQRLKVKI